MIVFREQTTALQLDDSKEQKVNTQQAMPATQKY
jgi:hypothetical protein